MKGIWKAANNQGKVAFLLKEKSKVLKENSKSWNKEVFDILNLEVAEAVKSLNYLDHQAAANIVVSSPSSLEEVGVKASSKVWEAMYNKESILRQKFRLMWIREGDSNSKCFYKFMKRYSRNCILSINIDKGRLDQVKEIKEKPDLIF